MQMNFGCFRFLLRVAFSAALLVLAGLNSSSAYELNCQYVHDPEMTAQAADPRLAAAVESALRTYQQMMGFDEIRHDVKALDALKLKLKKLNPEQNQDLKRFIQQHYTEVRLLKYDRKGPYKSFKRHLDLIISEKTNAPQFFRQQIIDKGATLEETLTQYFLLVHEWTQSSTVVQGEDVLLAGLQLQDGFMKRMSHLETWEHPLALYGSFVNGRALAHLSDLDFVVTKAGQEEKYSEEKVLSELTDFPFTEAQSHFMKKKSLHGLGYLNPLLLLVTKEALILRVYESLPSKRVFSQPQFTEYYF